MKFKVKLNDCYTEKRSCGGVVAMNYEPRANINRRNFVGLGAGALSAAMLASCTYRGGSAEEGPAVRRKPTVAATAENVRLIGRTFEEDGVTWLAQSGSAVEFRVTGQNLSIELKGAYGANNGPGERLRYAVLLDGEVVVDETIGKESHTVDVPTNGSLSDAVVEVIHLTEAQWGAVGVHSIMVESDEAAPVAPTAGKAMSIGFVGDSITCGYAVESKSYTEPFTTAKQNFMKTYAYLAARELDADYDTACYSGHGVVSGWSAGGEPNYQMLVPPIYDLVAKGYEQKWDFAANPRDVVVINLGTNDSSYTGSIESRMEEFSQGYAEFLAQVREHYTDALIVCTLGTMWGSEVLYPSLEKAVRTHTERTGDTRVVCYLSDPIDEADGVGTNGHPNEVSQRKSAKQLVKVIREAMGS